jgi:hypothetical protein
MIKKQSIFIIGIVLFFTGLVVLILLNRRPIEGFGEEEDAPAIVAIKTVLKNYANLQNELQKTNSLDKVYVSQSLQSIIDSANSSMKSLKDMYLAHSITYSDVKSGLKPHIKMFNEVVQKFNVNLYNLNVNKILPDKDPEKVSIYSATYKSQTE